MPVRSLWFPERHFHAAYRTVNYLFSKRSAHTCRRWRGVPLNIPPACPTLPAPAPLLTAPLHRTSTLPRKFSAADLSGIHQDPPTSPITSTSHRNARDAHMNLGATVDMVDVFNVVFQKRTRFSLPAPSLPLFSHYCCASCRLPPTMTATTHPHPIPATYHLLTGIRSVSELFQTVRYLPGVPGSLRHMLNGACSDCYACFLLRQDDDCFWRLRAFHLFTALYVLTRHGRGSRFSRINVKSGCDAPWTGRELLLGISYA